MTRHLEVRLNLPTAFFRDLTAFSTYHPIHASIELLRDTYQATHLGMPVAASKCHPTESRACGPTTRNGPSPTTIRDGYPGIITNGAYRLNMAFKQYMRLEANPYYWNAGIVQSKTDQHS